MKRLFLSLIFGIVLVFPSNSLFSCPATLGYLARLNDDSYYENKILSNATRMYGQMTGARGGITALAKWLDVRYATLHNWLTGSTPDLLRKNWNVKVEALEAQLFVLTGFTLAQIFPKAQFAPTGYDHLAWILPDTEFHTRAQMRMADPRFLALTYEDQAIRKKQRKVIAPLVEQLTWTGDQDIVRMRLGLRDDVEHSFQEIAEVFKMPTGEVFERYMKALELLVIIHRSREGTTAN